MSVPYTFEFSGTTGDVLLIADGMGGHQAGEQASVLAADGFLSGLGAPRDPDELVETLRGINRNIFDLGSREKHLQGMGTTVAGLIVHPDKLLWFNVGDSGVFRFRDDFLRQLSVDDVATASVSLGARKPGLTQALGGAPNFLEIDPHVGVEPLVPGWRYLLCSDGLSDVVPTSSIEQILAYSDEEAAQRMLDAALAEGAPDNVSLILLSVTAVEHGDDLG